MRGNRCPMCKSGAVGSTPEYMVCDEDSKAWESSSGLQNPVSPYNVQWLGIARLCRLINEATLSQVLKQSGYWSPGCPCPGYDAFRNMTEEHWVVTIT